MSNNNLKIRVARWYDSRTLDGGRTLREDMARLGIEAQIDHPVDNDYYTVTFNNQEDLNLYLMAGWVVKMPKFQRGMYKIYKR